MERSLLRIAHHHHRHHPRLGFGRIFIANIINRHRISLLNFKRVIKRAVYLYGNYYYYDPTGTNVVSRLYCV